MGSHVKRFNTPGVQILKPLSKQNKAAPKTVIRSLTGAQRVLGRSRRGALHSSNSSRSANGWQQASNPLPPDDEGTWEQQCDDEMLSDSAEAQEEAAAGAAAAAAPAPAAGAYAGSYRTTFTTAGAAAAAAAARDSERIKTQEASASRWREFHDDNILLFLRMHAKQAQVEQEYSAFLQQQVTRAVTTGACSGCGLSVSECRLVRTVEVTVIDIGCCCTVEVPVVECSRCGLQQLGQTI
jgi:hypothetical protein